MPFSAQKSMHSWVAAMPPVTDPAMVNILKIMGNWDTWKQSLYLWIKKRGNPIDMEYLVWFHCQPKLDYLPFPCEQWEIGGHLFRI